MARVVVVAWLWCMVGAEEYAGVGAGMPQYGADADYSAGSLVAPAAALSDDYRGHSPDAPAPLDYKYEEESQGNTEKHVKEIIETETWKKKPARKQRGLRHREVPLDDSEEPLRQHESSRRQPWARAGHRGDKARARDEGIKRGRSRRRELEDDARARPQDYVHSDYRDDKNLILDEDIDTYSRRKTTERIVRRKPRDRLFANPLKADFESESEDLLPDRKLKPESGLEYEDQQRGQQRRPLPGAVGGGGLVPEPSARYRAAAGKPALDGDQEESMRKNAGYSEYDYYDDMKRLNDIKTKLPLLLRRTTTRSAPGAAAGSTNDLMAMLWTAAARRAGAGGQPAPHAPPEAPARLDPLHSPDTIPSTTTTTEKPSTESTSELSIAEKSRISILKKAQKKESVKGDPTKKPPVLLQVTNKLPTIVMVEPPTSADPWMRARSVTNDAPEKLEHVKRLMRHKLVAGAKSIQDLTDNWDDMVCDYIDVSLLEAAAATSTKPTTLHYIILILVFVLR